MKKIIWLKLIKFVATVSVDANLAKIKLKIHQQHWLVRHSVVVYSINNLKITTQKKKCWIWKQQLSKLVAFNRSFDVFISYCLSKAAKRQKAKKYIEFIRYWWEPAAKVFFIIILFFHRFVSSAQRVQWQSKCFSCLLLSWIVYSRINKCALSIKFWLPHRQNSYWKFLSQCMTHQQFKRHKQHMRSFRIHNK